MNARALAPLVLLAAFLSPSPSHSAAAELDRVAPQLLGAAHRSTEAYDRLGELCDEIGHRITGSPRLEEAVTWAADLMRDYGLENVHTEEVVVPHWIRGKESAWLVSPSRQPLHILGLGRSVGTGEGGVEAEVVVVDSFEDLDSRPEEEIAGKIVLFDVPFQGYGKTVAYRGRGPSAAARRGAVACLVRSVGLDGLQTPHTGALRYAEDAPRIPAAAVTMEDAQRIARMVGRGRTVVAHLEMEARNAEETLSHNVVGEWRGSEAPEEIVVLGGHLDSWDVGQGAQDDGSGCMIALHAVRLIQQLGLRPKRTLRVVFWTNEEYGLRGGRAYAEAHADEIEHHVAAIESDGGNGRARGFRLDLREVESSDRPTDASIEDLRERALRFLDVVGAELRFVGADTMRAGGSGADISPLARAGVPCLGLDHEMSEYFRIHHTEADTFDRIDPDDLAHNVGVMAVMAFALADAPRGLRTGATP